MRVLDAGSFLDDIHMFFILLYLTRMRDLQMSIQFEMEVYPVLCAVLDKSLL